jgi:hypothetical protein
MSETEMGETEMSAVISRQCLASMHLHCEDPSCRCPVCHHTCGICGQECRAVHKLPVIAGHSDLSEKEACSTCYRTVIALLPKKGQGCERCGKPQGYRSLRGQDGSLYLCASCQQAGGSLIQLRT